MRIRTNGRSVAINTQAEDWVTMYINGQPDGIYQTADVLTWEGWRELAVLDPEDPADVARLLTLSRFDEALLEHHDDEWFAQELAERLANPTEVPA